MIAKLNSTNNGSITRLGALALLCCFLCLPARIAEGGTTITARPASANEVVIPTSSVLAGLVHGQTMRITLFNPPGLPRVQIRAQVKLFDAQGRVIAESAEVVIPPGEFRFFDFNRDDISLGGEDGTGRLQVRGDITCFFSRDTNDAGRDQIPGSFETMDNNTEASGSCPGSCYIPLLVICKGV